MTLASRPVLACTAEALQPSRRLQPLPWSSRVLAVSPGAHHLRPAAATLAWAAVALAPVRQRRLGRSRRSYICLSANVGGAGSDAATSTSADASGEGGASSGTVIALPRSASSAVRELFAGLRSGQAASVQGQREAAARVRALFAPGLVYDDLTQELARGTDYIAEVIDTIISLPAGAEVALEDVDDGLSSSGFIWRATEGGVSVKGTGFARVDESGRIAYLCTLPEPLLKTGEATTAFLRLATAAMGGPQEPVPEVRARVKSPKQPGKIPANEVVRYLYQEVQYADVEGGAVAFFSPGIVYEDTVYTSPRRGRAEVESFFNRGSIPGFAFVVDEISDGRSACGFRWHAEIAGKMGPRGLTFYKLGADGLVTYVRDIPESTMKPPPFLRLAYAWAGLAAPAGSRRAALASAAAAIGGEPGAQGGR